MPYGPVQTYPKTAFQSVDFWKRGLAVLVRMIENGGFGKRLRHGHRYQKVCILPSKISLTDTVFSHYCVFVWTGKNDLKTERVDAEFSNKKRIRVDRALGCSIRNFAPLKSVFTHVASIYLLEQKKALRT